MPDTLLSKLAAKWSYYSDGMRVAGIILLGALGHAIYQQKKYRHTDRPRDLRDFYSSLFLAIIAGLAFAFIGRYAKLEDEPLYLMIIIGTVFGYDGIIDFHEVIKRRAVRILKSLFGS